MIHYTDKNTLVVWGYETDDDAQHFNPQYDALVPMSEELFAQYQEQRQCSDWSLTGWIENPTKRAALDEEEKQAQILDLKNQLKDLVTNLKIEEVTGGDTGDLINQITQKKADLDALTA